jgi:hypothetical protein
LTLWEKTASIAGGFKLIRMTRLFYPVIMTLLLFTAAPQSFSQVKKVLPHYLDLDGAQSLSPSLYERDAYQAILRRNPEMRSALRFDVHWKGPRRAGPLLIRVECRGSESDPARPVVLESSVAPPRFFGKWTSLTLEGEPYQQFGELIAWRVSLWDGDRLISEQRSFLW